MWKRPKLCKKNENSCDKIQVIAFLLLNILDQIFKISTIVETLVTLLVPLLHGTAAVGSIDQLPCCLVQGRCWYFCEFFKNLEFKVCFFEFLYVMCMFIRGDIDFTLSCTRVTREFYKNNICLTLDTNDVWKKCSNHSLFYYINHPFLYKVGEGRREEHAYIWEENDIF